MITCTHTPANILMVPAELLTFYSVSNESSFLKYRLLSSASVQDGDSSSLACGKTTKWKIKTSEIPMRRKACSHSTICHFGKSHEHSQYVFWHSLLPKCVKEVKLDKKYLCGVNGGKS